MKRRLICLLLTVLFVIMSVPTTAYAKDVKVTFEYYADNTSGSPFCTIESSISDNTRLKNVRIPSPSNIPYGYTQESDFSDDWRRIKDLDSKTIKVIYTKTVELTVNFYKDEVSDGFLGYGSTKFNTQTMTADKSTLVGALSIPTPSNIPNGYTFAYIDTNNSATVGSLSSKRIDVVYTKGSTVDVTIKHVYSGASSRLKNLVEEHNETITVAKGSSFDASKYIWRLNSKWVVSSYEPDKINTVTKDTTITIYYKPWDPAGGSIYHGYGNDGCKCSGCSPYCAARDADNEGACTQHHVCTGDNSPCGKTGWNCGDPACLCCKGQQESETSLKIYLMSGNLNLKGTGGDNFIWVSINESDIVNGKYTIKTDDGVPATVTFGGKTYTIANPDEATKTVSVETGSRTNTTEIQYTEVPVVTYADVTVKHVYKHLDYKGNEITTDRITDTDTTTYANQTVGSTITVAAKNKTGYTADSGNNYSVAVVTGGNTVTLNYIKQDAPAEISVIVERIYTTYYEGTTTVVGEPVKTTVTLKATQSDIGKTIQVDDVPIYNGATYTLVGTIPAPKWTENPNSTITVNYSRYIEDARTAQAKLVYKYGETVLKTDEVKTFGKSALESFDAQTATGTASLTVDKSDITANGLVYTVKGENTVTTSLTLGDSTVKEIIIQCEPKMANVTVNYVYNIYYVNGSLNDKYTHALENQQVQVGAQYMIPEDADKDSTNWAYDNSSYYIGDTLSINSAITLTVTRKCTSDARTFKVTVTHDYPGNNDPAPTETQVAELSSYTATPDTKNGIYTLTGVTVDGKAVTGFGTGSQVFNSIDDNHTVVYTYANIAAIVTVHHNFYLTTDGVESIVGTLTKTETPAYNLGDTIEVASLIKADADLIGEHAGYSYYSIDPTADITLTAENNTVVINIKYTKTTNNEYPVTVNYYFGSVETANLLGSENAGSFAFGTLLSAVAANHTFQTSFNKDNKTYSNGQMETIAADAKVTTTGGVINYIFADSVNDQAEVIVNYYVGNATDTDNYIGTTTLSADIGSALADVAVNLGLFYTDDALGTAAYYNNGQKQPVTGIVKKIETGATNTNVINVFYTIKTAMVPVDYYADGALMEGMSTAVEAAYGTAYADVAVDTATNLVELNLTGDYSLDKVETPSGKFEPDSPTTPINVYYTTNTYSYSVRYDVEDPEALGTFVTGTPAAAGKAAADTVFGTLLSAENIAATVNAMTAPANYAYGTGTLTNAEDTISKTETNLLIVRVPLATTSVAVNFYKDDVTGVQATKTVNSFIGANMTDINIALPTDNAAAFEGYGVRTVEYDPESAIAAAEGNVISVYYERADASVTIEYRLNSVTGERVGDDVTVNTKLGYTFAQVYFNPNLYNTNNNYTTAVAYPASLAETIVAEEGNRIVVVYTLGAADVSVIYYRDFIGGTTLGTATISSVDAGTAASAIAVDANAYRPDGYNEGSVNPQFETVSATGNNVIYVLYTVQSGMVSINYYRDSATTANQLGIVGASATVGSSLSSVAVDTNYLRPDGYTGTTVDYLASVVTYEGPNVINVIYTNSSVLPEETPVNPETPEETPVTPVETPEIPEEPVTIPENDVPRADNETAAEPPKEELVVTDEIVDEDIPFAAPQTGDMNVLFALGAAISSLIGIIGSSKKSKKK